MLSLQGLSLFLLLPLLFLLSYGVFSRSRRPSLLFPPGPEPKPVIGNLLDIPFSQKPWLKYLEWSKRLNSKIIHMSAVNIHIMVLHTIEDATELLQKRSAIYSDRPIIPILELLGMDFGSGGLPYGDRWRKHRRAFQESLMKERIYSYHHLMTKKAHLLLGEFLNHPERFSEHCKWLAASFALHATFAYDVIPEKKSDYIIEAADNAMRTAAELAIPGRTLINMFPILGSIPPQWVPGAYTQKLAAGIKRSVVQFKTELFSRVKKNMASNMHEDCILVKLLQHREECPSFTFDDDTLQDVAGTIYLAGVETIQSAQMTFILSLAVHPEQQRKAQEEIDRVVGTDRLPTFDDRASLPYVEALYREVQRWRPVTPMGLPHASVKDDVYKGFFIPKGTFVFPNVWSITRDADRYHDPECFMPERFFNPDGTLNNDTIGYGFGFGRRICPGRHLADPMVWLALASVLSMFNISMAKDDNGNEIDIDSDDFVDSVVTHPSPFKCSIVPRSAQAEALIRTAVSNGRKA